MHAALEVRPIADGDIEAVIALWARAALLRPWNDPAKDIAFARATPTSTVLVGLAGERIVATAMAGHDGHRGWLYYVAVDPGAQGTGTGRRIVAAAEAWLAGQGVWKVQLLIRADNAQAQGFYQRLGYADTQSRCFQKVLG